MPRYLDVAKIKQELDEAIALYRTELSRIQKEEASLEEGLIQAVEKRKVDTLKEKLT